MNDMNNISIYNKVAAVTNSPSAAPSAHMAHAESAEYAKAASLRPQLAAAPSVFSRMASTSEASATLCSLRPLRETKKSTRENPRLTKSQRPIANSLFRKASVLCTLCSVLLISSCTHDEIIPPTPLAPQGTKTVTVDFQLPEGKPGFEGQSTDNRVQSTDNRVQSTDDRVQSTDDRVQSTDNRGQSTDNGVQSTDNRGQIAETSAATDGLCTLYSELCTLNATRSTASWAEGDELLMTVGVSNDNNFAYAYLTLKYDGSWWDVVTDKSYARIILNNAATNYTYADYPLLDDITDLSLDEGLTLVLDEAFGEVTTYSVNATYAPELEWDITPDANGAVTDVNLKLKATATTTAPECWEVSSGEWSTNQARLRVHTGAAGDVVTLTSEKFYPNSIGKSADGIYTATTDADGNAYFYGTADSGVVDGSTSHALTSGFNLSLTAVGVGSIAVPIAPVTLLEASTLVPVQLVKGNSYRLVATEKRPDTESMAVINGTLGDEALQTAIDAAIEAGKTTLYVTGEPVGNISIAIRNSGAAEGSIDLILADATAIGEDAFCNCDALKSVSLPAVTMIGYNAFRGCSALTSVELPVATSIGDGAFDECTSLTSVSLPEATMIRDYTFSDCSALTSVSAPEATSIGENAFLNCVALESVSLLAAETIGDCAFQECIALTSLTFGEVITSVGEYAFDSASTTTCDLTLNSDQQYSTDQNLRPDVNNMWAGKNWASIRWSTNSN